MSVLVKSNAELISPPASERAIISEKPSAFAVAQLSQFQTPIAHPLDRYVNATASNAELPRREYGLRQ
jgi:hypothetical protein